MGMDIYSTMDVSTEDDLFFLKKYSEYSCMANRMPEIKNQSMHSSEMQEIRRVFEIDPIVDDRNDIRYISELKKKAVELLAFKGKELGSQRYDSLKATEIISVAKRENYSLNCRYRTFLFTLMALAAGLKARMVSCMAMDLRYIDCHWVTEIYSQAYGKWIVVDVPLDFFYFDEKAIPLNLREMRKRIIEEKGIKLFSTDRDHIRFVQEYWKKNIFRFRFASENSCDFLRSTEKEFFCLNPYGFVMKDKKYVRNNKAISCKYFYNDERIWDASNE